MSSTDLDLELDIPLTLPLKIQCHKIITGYYSLLLSGKLGMIFRKNELTSQGFILYSRILGGEFKGDIKIMAYIKRMNVSTGDRTVQQKSFWGNHYL